MRKRIKFSKNGMIKYIGHLDLLRVFQRALRKASIPLAYSQGFNPHPLISFAQPLGLGFTSEGEYLEITLTDHVGNDELIEKANQALPEGIKITECIDLSEKEPKAMAMVDAAQYLIELDRTINETDIERFITQDTIFIKKVTKKKKIKEVDIKPGIIELELKDDVLKVICEAGTNNIKPQVIISSLYKFLDYDYDEFAIRYHRVDLYTKENDELKPLIWSD